jgi:hypothetical protein
MRGRKDYEEISKVSFSYGWINLGLHQDFLASLVAALLQIKKHDKIHNKKAG